MPAARIIPCLDVADGRVVKGVQFRDHRDVGDIVDLALRYRDEGADELVFYDITASADRRSVDPAWVRRVSAVIDIPFSVAGGIGDVETAARCLAAGADKISVNSPALARPALIAELAEAFGRQCVVLGIDSLRSASGDWRVKQFTGRPDATADAGRETIAWAVRGSRARRRRDRPQLHGPRRGARRLRPRPTRGAGRGGRRPHHRLGRRRHAGAFRRSLRRGRQRRARRKRVP